jgi:hypothetical protein
MVAGVLVVLVLLLAPYVRPWVAQRSQIADGNRRVQDLQRQVTALSDQRRQWDDPAYVRAQARQRLNFVMPGQTGLVVLDDSPAPKSAADPRSVDAAVPSRVDGQPWYATVWQSVRIAGDPDTGRSTSATTP